jgi:hypothetical protein
MSAAVASGLRSVWSIILARSVAEIGGSGAWGVSFVCDCAIR